jgi:hypothetical protein
LALTDIRTTNEDTCPFAAMLHSIFGGKFLLHHYSDCKDTAMVLDSDGNIIGEAYTLRSHPRSWSIHTKPFGGTVPEEQIIFVE